MNIVSKLTINYKSPGINTIEWDTYQPQIDQTLIDHLNLLYKIIGSDMTFEKYSNMSNQSIIKLNRELKINSLL